MRTQTIPDNHHLLAVIMMDHPQKENHIQRTDRTVKDGETKIQSLSDRCHRDKTESCLRVSTKCFTQHDRLANLCPRRSTNRSQRKARLIPENQGNTEFFRFFLVVSTSVVPSPRLLRRNACATSRQAFVARDREWATGRGRCEVPS